MNDREENCRDLGREMDRLIQEVHGLKQENAALKLEIGRCPHDWCEDCKNQEQYVRSEAVINEE